MIEAAYVLLFVLNPLTIAIAIVLSKRITQGGIVSEVQAAVDAVTAQLLRAKDEITAQISKLESDLLAGRQPDLTALRAAAQALDDVAPDVPAKDEDSPEAPDVPEGFPEGVTEDQ